MYRRRPQEGPLEQGDILRCVPRLSPTLNSPGLIRRTGGVSLCTKALEEPFAQGDVIAVEVDLVDAIVLTQSCDALRSPFIHLAPIAALDGISQDALKRAKAVRKIATGLDPIGGIYLPDVSQLGWQRRVAHLDRAFSLPRADLQEYVRIHKAVAAGLSNHALEYLQHRLSVVFGRMARDDADWPSLEDLKDARASLESEIAKLATRRGRCSDPGEQEDLDGEIEGLSQELADLPRRERLVSEHVANEFPPENRLTEA